MLAVVLSHDLGRNFIEFKQLPGLVGVAGRDNELISSGLQLIDNRGEEWNMRGIIEIYPDLPLPPRPVAAYSVRPAGLGNTGRSSRVRVLCADLPIRQSALHDIYTMSE